MLRIAMKKIKETKISYWAAHFTTIVSVTLLLVLVGVIMLTGIAAGNASVEIKQQQQVSLIMTDSVDNAVAKVISDSLRRAPYVNTIRVITREQALADWNKATGEDVAAIAGGNFFTPEVELSLKAAYACPDSVKRVTTQLRGVPGVEEVVVPDAEMLTSMDNFFSRTLLVLGIVAVAMIIISFVLINNTVLLTIYSRRFTIHTMQLVGATPGFIRRPFVINNLLSGLIAAVAACTILGGGLQFLIHSQMPDIAAYISWTEAALVGVVLLAAGMAICVVSALIATNRYLRKNYDELFLS